MSFSNLADRRPMYLEKSHSFAFSVRVEDRLHVNIISETDDACYLTVRPEPFKLGQDDDDLVLGSVAADGEGFKIDGTFFEGELTEEQEALLSEREQERWIAESRLFLFSVQAAAMDLDPEQEWFYDVTYVKNGYSISLSNGPLVLGANPANRAAQNSYGGNVNVYDLIGVLDNNNMINVTTSLPMPQDGRPGLGTYYCILPFNPTVGQTTDIEMSAFVIPTGRNLAEGDIVHSSSSSGLLGTVSSVNWNENPITVTVTTLSAYGVDGLNALTYANVITGSAQSGDPSWATVTTNNQDWTVAQSKVPLPTGHRYNVGDLVIGFARQNSTAGAPAKVFIGLVKSFTGTSTITVTTKYTVDLVDSSSVAGLLDSKANSTLQVNGVGIISDSISLNQGHIADTASYVRMLPSERTKLSALPSNANLQSALSGKADSSHTHTIDKVTGLQAALDSKVASSTVRNIVKLTQSAYDALGTKDAQTLYVIVG